MEFRKVNFADPNTESKKLDEDDFGPSSGPLSAVRAFDAFPKTKPSYTEHTQSGGIWTVVLVIASVLLSFTELQRWWVGNTTHSFSVEQGVGHELQINLDMVVAMQCNDLHLNVQDAAGDRILASRALKKEATILAEWSGSEKGKLGKSKEERMRSRKAKKEYQEEDVHDYLGKAQRPKQWKRTPKLPRGVKADSCRIYGSMHLNKVQGDFHITARGHGYVEMGAHLDHTAFNFTHAVNELSFGPRYPLLENPLDNTVAMADDHFHKFQYFLSVVPTVYTTDARALARIDKSYESPSSGDDGLKLHPYRSSNKHVFTNQYAVTEQSRVVPDHMAPGIFVKFDIEPIALTIAEEWQNVPSLFIRIVNVVSGVLVAGGWLFQLTEWSKENRKPARQREGSWVMLNTDLKSSDEKRKASVYMNALATSGPGFGVGSNYGPETPTSPIGHRGSIYHDAINSSRHGSFYGQDGAPNVHRGSVYAPNGINGFRSNSFVTADQPPTAGQAKDSSKDA